MASHVLENKNTQLMTLWKWLEMHQFKEMKSNWLLTQLRRSSQKLGLKNIPTQAETLHHNRVRD